MVLVRGVWYVCTLFVGTCYYALLVILTWLRRVPYQRGGLYDTIPRDYGRFLLRVNGLSASALGLEHLEGARPCVFVSNHLSWIDVLALVAVIPPPVRFVAKKELARVPLLGQAMRADRQIFIDRHDRGAAMSAYGEAAQEIREGMSAIIFAEGTRSRTGKLQEFKKGPFVLAITAQVPVVPVCVEGTFEVLPKGAIAPKPHPIVVRFGRPIPTVGLDYDDRERLSHEARAAILDMQHQPV